MSYFDTIDFENQFSSTTDNQNSQNSINFLENSFEEEQNTFMIKEDNFFTEINKINSMPINQNPEIIKTENNININQNPIHNITPRNLLFIPETQKETKTKSLLGRKKANSDEEGEHTKYAQDNMIRKFKPYFKDSLKDLINSIIKKDIRFPNDMINGKKYQKMELLNISQEQVKDISVKSNKELLEKKIKDFFSVEISGNYSNYPKNFNALLIEELYKIENGEKVTCILEKTVKESLKFFRMDEDVFYDPEYSCLKGLEKKFLDFKKHLLIKNDKKYVDDMIYLINNFEIIYAKKRSRAKRIKKIN